MRTCGTLFSGGGLADVGLKAAGYTPVLAVEYDPQIAEVYARNHGEHVHVCGVETLDYRPYAGLDLLWASPVCVNASVAKTDGKEEAGDLASADAVCRALTEIRPGRFLLENVGGYARFESFHRIVRHLWAMGYGTRWEVLNAADFGVPQTRRRLLLRALRGERFVPRLRETHAERPDEGETLFGDSAEQSPWVGWYAAIEDLLETLPESKFAPWQIARLREMECFRPTLVHPTADCEWFVTRQACEPSFTCGVGGGFPRAFLVDRHQSKHGEISARGENLKALAETVTAGKFSPRALLVGDQRGPGFGKSNQGLQVTPEQAPAPTIRALASGGAPPRALLVQGTSTLDTRDGSPPSPSVLATVQAKAAIPKAWFENGRVVAMTPRALARFQAVPDGYALPEKKALACKIIGNGVPCVLAQRVAESLG